MCTDISVSLVLLNKLKGLYAPGRVSGSYFFPVTD